MLVERSSNLVGQTLREAKAFDRIGVTIVGAWIGGKFVITPDQNTVIEENTILLITGEHGDFEDLQTRQIRAHHEHEPRVVVCGYGTVRQSLKRCKQRDWTSRQSISNLKTV
ncbi:TrkA C-terminal domain-containing protein [Natrialbaceae archaeon A-chndr2]